MIQRILQSTIENRMFSGKTILILGARQVGKTTLLNQISKEIPEKLIWINADNPDDRALLDNINSSRAKELFRSGQIIIIDEAQRLENSGLTLKIIHDNCEGIQLIATGSSAFELTDKIKEALTGRKRSYNLFPISIPELIKHSNKIEVLRSIETRLIFGSYPEVINNSGNEKEILQELVSDYLYKDVFSLKEVRKPDVLEKLVKALAFQIGNQVSNRELSNLIGVDKETIERYINLLEESFIIFRLPSFSRNIRNELKKSKKIYFTDTGVRNAVINEFKPLGIRNDAGQLWENLMISERIKYLDYNKTYGKPYFWRTSRQQEIDYIEEVDNQILAFEFKWGAGRNYKFPKSFAENYPNAIFKVINRDNFFEFLN